MNTTFAFLRAINVGGHNVKNDRLVELFGDLGYGDADAFLASGNVIFRTGTEDFGGAERTIEEHLEQALGFEATTFLRTAEELRAIVNYEPFSPSELRKEENTLYVAFLKEAPGPGARDTLSAHATETDDLHLEGREVYWICGTKSYESDFSGTVLEKTLGIPATLRNVRTLRRLADKYL